MRRFLAIHFSILAAALVLATPRTAAADKSAGHDFIDEARLFQRVVACSDTPEIPPGYDAAIVEQYCKPLRKLGENFRKRYVARAERFFAKWRPKDLPRKVVYPFGGGDLASALVTYPNATEITTISLEHPGDPRRLERLRKDPKRLEASLELFGLVGGSLLKWHDSASKNLRKMEKGPVPGQLSMFMLALVVLEYEPVSLKFFRIEPNGSLHYYTKKEIDDLDGTLASKLETRWIDTDYSIAFRNMELTFRRRGVANAPLITHRHIAFNLDNEHFGKSELRKHLEKKGKVSAMTKAASFLLWMYDFKEIRQYLLDNMAFMVSDATGILPKHALKAGYLQTTFGTFEEAFLEYAQGKNSKAMAEMWAEQKKRRLGFRYGYPDANGNYHLLITRPRARHKKSR